MRGTVVGEKVQSQAQTRAWDEACDRIGLGKSESAKEKGVFVWDPVQGKLVRPGERLEEQRALDAPIVTDRYLEGTVANDGTDIGSRAKREAYMREHNLVDPRDFRQHYRTKEAERARFYETGFATQAEEKATREVAARIVSETIDSRQRDYDRERSRRDNERDKRGKGFQT